MKLDLKLVLVAALSVIVFFILLVVGNQDARERNEGGIPEFKSVEQPKRPRDEFIVEKIVQRQEKGIDMRSGLFLMNHAHLLEDLAKVKIESSDSEVFTLNDFCFKPHTAIYKTDNIHTPSYVRNLYSEMRALSPCLITSPLNCYLDSFRVEQTISYWNSSGMLDGINRRLRDAYIAASEAFGEDDISKRPYSHAKYGPDLIKDWAGHFSKLAHQKDTSYLDIVAKWISSTQSHRKVCVDSLQSCDDPRAENYFDICKAFQDLNAYERNTDRKLNFRMGEKNFTTLLDCSKDSDLFIEWARQDEQRGIVQAFQPWVKTLDYKKIASERCGGSFEENKALELFDGRRNFGDGFSSIRTEIFLMTPSSLLQTLRKRDEVRFGKSSRTLDEATELLTKFREKLRMRIEKQNGHESNKKICATSEVVTPLESSRISTPPDVKFIVYTVLFIASVITIMFGGLVWWPNIAWSIIFSTLRNLVSIGLFMLYGHKNNVIVLDSTLIGLLVIQQLVNLFMTTRLSQCRYRLHNCVQRLKFRDYRSNFSSIATMISAKERRQLNYTLAKYTAYQTAQDAYSQDDFEKITPFWWILSIFVFPIAVVYWYQVDATCHLVILAIAPSIVMGCIEEFCTKWFYVSQRIELRKELNRILVEGIRETTRESDEAVFSGERQLESTAEPQSSEQSFIQRTFRALRKDTYDSNPIMKHPHELSRCLRLVTMKFYLQLLNWKPVFAIIFCFAAISLFFTSAYLLFLPVSRVSEPSIPNDDLFIDLNIESSFPENYEILKKFSQKVEETVPFLRVASNWQNSFERFKQGNNRDDENATLASWMHSEPINAAITASFVEMDENALTMPFLFRMRYDIQNSANKTIMTDIAEKLVPLLAEHSTASMSLTPSGVAYEPFHEMVVAWSNYAYRQLIGTALLFALLVIFVFLFATTPAIFIALSFSLFTIATRIEISGLCSLLSVDNSVHLNNLGLVIGLLAAWSPFAELCRFRSRVLAREKTKRTPELSPKYRIRVPFIAATDVVQYFSVIFSVLLISLPFFTVLAPLRGLVLPTGVLLLAIPLALFNSIAVTFATKLMFEPKVLLTLCENLQGATTIVAQVHAFSHKIDRPRFDNSLEMGAIQPTERDRFFGPPPKYRQKAEEEESETEEEEIDVVNVSDDDQPGPSSKRLRPPGDEEIPAKRAVLDCHQLLCGMPIDSTCFDGSGQIVYHQDFINRAEEFYEMGDDEELIEVPLNENGDELEIGREEEVDAMLGAEEDTDEEDEEHEHLMEDAPQLDHRGVPQMVRRLVPRDPRIEPPSMEEYIQANDRSLHPELPERHPRADQYPPDYPRALIAYAEDPFWTQRTVPLPLDIIVPPRPFDYMRIEERTPPPEDFDYVPAPGGLPIPPEAYILREERRRKFEEDKKKKKDGDGP